MRKQSLLVFPFTENSFPVIKLLATIDEYVIGKIVAPKAVALAGTDIGMVTNRGKLGYSIENSFADSLQDCDSVLVLNHNTEFKSYVTENLDMAIKAGKKIILTFTPEDELKTVLEESKASVMYKDISKYEWENRTGAERHIETPVVFIGGTMPNGVANELTVELTNEFRSNGYAVETVCTDKNLLIDDSYHKIPDFLYEKEFGELQKIEALKSWLCNIERDKMPHLIIATVPGAMMSFDNVIHSDYGIYPYLFSAAIKPDYFILDIGCGYNQEFYGMVSEHFKHRYGYSVNYVVKSNMALDISGTRERRKYQYHYNSSSKLLREFEKEDNVEIKESFVFEDDCFDDLFSDIVLTLSVME